MRILRTEAEDVGEGGLLTFALFAACNFYTIKQEARRYRRAGDVVTEALPAFCAFCFSLCFLAFARCLCQATFLVLFMVVLLSN